MLTELLTVIGKSIARLLVDLFHEDFQVDSLQGHWDYVEPVLFGWAAGRVIDRYWEEYLAPLHRRAVVQAHEWMTGSSLLYLKGTSPQIGTVFTTHATVLGRALSSAGRSLLFVWTWRGDRFFKAIE